ncbi:unnamed protein product [Didymodactylos carnosus]|uniref:Major facilitator superfamily (MFS) profile domain-containing protein n=1 Tax=Didymodactylos carnosus TaxID=1234261 RepID=A0A8S2ENA8_9BILA|nr:unnamed protein product [Didymodactylos carnosus]CAF4037330.1 unnamed protein product [Didymodactylos carnosus]
MKYARYFLVWGSFSDYYGRKICLIVSSILFITTSIICIFTPNIIYLIIFRALQGASITATDAVGLGVIADVFAPTQRGFATGMFLIPFNIGPILGPVLGGSLSDSFGWRSTFVFLALYAFLTTIMILILLPETHQYFVLQRHQQALGSITIEVDLIHKPVFAAPWKPLSVLTDLSIAPYILLMTIAFTTFFMSLIALPDQLSSKPYNLNEAIIGFCYIPSGIGLLIGSALGGSLADRAGRYYSGKIPESRLIPASFGAFFVPVGLLFYGCSLHFKLNLTLVIIATFIVAFGHSVYEPAGFSYLTNKKQDEAGAISAVVIFLPFIFSGLGTVVAAPIIKAVGIGLLFSILAGLSIISIIIANTVVFVKVQQKKHSEKR